MSETIFTKLDLEVLITRGISEEKVLSQIEIFNKGIPYLKLKKPCTLGDGITTLPEGELQRLNRSYTEKVLSKKVIIMVPASGAASRMFKFLLSMNDKYSNFNLADITRKAELQDQDHLDLLQFLKGLKKFAFFDDLKTSISRQKLDIDNCISKGRFKAILENLLSLEGLNYGNLPKGMIKFHRYYDHSRTPFEEHIVEAIAYARDKDQVARIHFTVSEHFQEKIQSYLQKVRTRYETKGIRLEMSFSIQEPSTDTVAVDMQNNLFRDSSGNLVFRPGGHGALLNNLNNLNEDVVFIKNIDNVVPDRLKDGTCFYKKAFGGYLIELQEKIFQIVAGLAAGKTDDSFLAQAFIFARDKLSIIPPERINHAGKNKKAEYLFSVLNRPLRVCGMVKNVGEPGGGPFWIEDKNHTLSLQIVESAQVDLKSQQQCNIWESSTHFNPVDLACGVKDYSGKPFDLMDFTDTEAGFISYKSKDGRELKALELPGLWNGAMACWNTVYLELPLSTFNPVKTVNDLLRQEHQT